MTAGEAVGAMYFKITRHKKPSNHLAFKAWVVLVSQEQKVVTASKVQAYI